MFGWKELKFWRGSEVRIEVLDEDEVGRGKERKFLALYMR